MMGRTLDSLVRTIKALDIKPLARSFHTLSLIGSIFIVGGMCYVFSLYNNVVMLEFDLSVKTDGAAEVFYSYGEGYSSNNRQGFNIFNGRKVYEVPIIQGFESKIKRIRFDPISEASGVIELHSLSINGKKYSKSTLMNLLIPLNSLEVLVAGDVVELNVIGGDPYLDFSTDGIETSKKSINFWFCLAGLACFYMALFCSFRFFIKIKEDGYTLDTGQLVTILFCFLFFVFCTVSSVFSPPFQSPDEFKHIERAYFISQGEWNLSSYGDEYGGDIDTGLLAYQKAYQGIARQKNIKVSERRRAEAEAIRWSKNEIFLTHVATAPYMFPIYLPQALAFKIGQELNLSIDKSYRLARFMVLAISVLVLCVAFIFARPNFLTWFVLFLPMTLFQFSAVTVDAFSIALSVLIVSIYLFDKGRFLPSSSFCLMLVAIVIVTTSRMYMLPLALLPVLLLNKNKKNIYFLGGALLIIALWITLGWIKVVDARVDVGISKGEMILYYINSPLKVCMILFNTLDYYKLFYLQTFVGVLGWLDTFFNDGFYRVSTILLAIMTTISFSYDDMKSGWLSRGLMLVVSFSSIILIFLALLLSWTEHPAEIIVGIQGRYFHIPVIILSYAISTQRKWKNSTLYIISTAILFCWIVFSLSSMCELMLERYYLS